MKYVWENLDEWEAELIKDIRPPFNHDKKD